MSATSVMADSAATKYYYADAQNKTVGPVTTDELQALIRDGALRPDPMVVPEGMSEWRPLSQQGVGQAGAGAATGPFGQQSVESRFCSKCGTPVTTNVPACPKCGAPISQANEAVAAALDACKTALQSALTAFKLLGGDPVGGLPQAASILGPTRSLGAGVSFGVIFALCLTITFYRLAREMLGSTPDGFGEFLRIAGVALVPFVSLTGAMMAAGAICRAPGTIGQATLIAGSSVLPWGAACLLTGFLGIGNVEVIGVLFVVSLCLLILMLFSGMTRVYRMSDRAATLAVPLVLLASAWLCKIIYASMLQDILRSGYSGFPRGQF